jgi:glutamate synthase (NADPH/NADH) small chain
MVPVEGTETLYPADSGIVSISQGPANKLMNTTKGLQAYDRGLIATDEEGHTSLPGVFASGDVVKGARTVVEAVKYSKIVAEAMDRYMMSLEK